MEPVVNGTLDCGDNGCALGYTLHQVYLLTFATIFVHIRLFCLGPHDTSIHCPEQIYSNKKNLGYIFYNDERPANTTSTRTDPLDTVMASGATPVHDESSSGGHNKGVLALDAKAGFWLVHSVPKLPDISLPAFRWTASQEYGQTFLCLAATVPNINAIAKQVLYQPSFVHHIDDSFNGLRLDHFLGNLAVIRGISIYIYKGISEYINIYI